MAGARHQAGLSLRALTFFSSRRVGFSGLKCRDGKTWLVPEKHRNVRRNLFPESALSKTVQKKQEKMQNPTEIKPDLVIVMNRIYVPEISEMIEGLGLKPQIMAL